MRFSSFSLPLPFELHCQQCLLLHTFAHTHTVAHTHTHTHTHNRSELTFSLSLPFIYAQWLAHTLAHTHTHTHTQWAPPFSLSVSHTHTDQKRKTPTGLILFLGMKNQSVFIFFFINNSVSQFGSQCQQLG